MGFYDESPSNDGSHFEATTSAAPTPALKSFLSMEIILVTLVSTVMIVAFFALTPVIKKIANNCCH